MNARPLGVGRQNFDRVFSFSPGLDERIVSRAIAARPLVVPPLGGEVRGVARPRSVHAPAELELDAIVNECLHVQSTSDDIEGLEEFFERTAALVRSGRHYLEEGEKEDRHREAPVERPGVSADDAHRSAYAHHRDQERVRST